MATNPESLPTLTTTITPTETPTTPTKVPKSPGPKISCPLCNRLLPRRNLQKHYLAKHSDGQEFRRGRIPCALCRKNFGNVRQLAGHLRVCENAFVCWPFPPPTIFHLSNKWGIENLSELRGVVWNYFVVRPICYSLLCGAFAHVREGEETNVFQARHGVEKSESDKVAGEQALKRYPVLKTQMRDVREVGKEKVKVKEEVRE